MSDMAKQARAAMKSKAQRLTTADPHQKVDSSTWTPPEPLNTEAKTGLRPISRRAFKVGGKVMGAAGKANIGVAPRSKSGNKPITADSMANKDMKSANEDRSGVKHVGALKDGGRAKKLGGGALDPRAALMARRGTPAGTNPAMVRSPGRPDPRMIAALKAQAAAAGPDQSAGGAGMSPMKKGGRAKKYMGGPMMQPGGMMMPVAGALGGGAPAAGAPLPPAGGMSNLPNQDKNDLYGGRIGVNPYKKGGKVHEDVAADKALIKKMVKPSARTARKEGGGVFTGPGYPGKIPGVTGGREAHAAGGATGKKKGKTNINIVIAAGKPGMGMDNPMGGPTPPPPGMIPPAPGAAPVPMPMPAGGPPAAAAAPMPIPYPVPMGGGGGGGPLPRKAGGRTYRSYKDMDAGAGSGLGRLEKTEIAEHKRGERKAGGRTYRSYKDMDAGAGSGLGRLEKTEIQAHKR